MDYRERAAELISSYVNISTELVYNFIETPGKSEIGDLSFPCFKLCGVIDLNPVIMARELENNIGSREFEKIESVGPYLNFFIDKSLFVEEIINNILNKKNQCKQESILDKKSISIELLYFNIKKRFSIDDFFSIILSNALSAIFTRQGYEVTVKEFLFAENKEFEFIYSYIKKPEITIINNSMNKAQNIIEGLEEKNLICNEETVKFISLEKYNMAPYIVWKNDYGITNSMKILTSILEMEERFDNHTNIFISDSLNTYKFKQLANVLELFGYKKNNFVHVEYGNIKIEEDGTLKGSAATISVLDILLVIIKFVKSSNKLKGEILYRKSINILIFSLMMNFRSRNIIIDINDLKLLKNKSLNYVENINCRILAIIEWSREIDSDIKFILSINERVRITKKLMDFERVIDVSMKELEPSYIAHYVFELAQEIGRVFDKVFPEEKNIFAWEYEDIMILKAANQVIENGLALIGIEFSYLYRK